MKITEGTLDTIKPAGARIEPKTNKDTERGRQSALIDKSEKVVISQQGREISRAEMLVKSLPEVRAEKVDQIKQAIQDGTFEIDNLKLAENIIKEHLLDDIL